MESLIELHRLGRWLTEKWAISTAATLVGPWSSMTSTASVWLTILSDRVPLTVHDLILALSDLPQDAKLYVPIGLESAYAFDVEVWKKRDGEVRVFIIPGPSKPVPYPGRGASDSNTESKIRFVKKHGT